MKTSTLTIGNVPSPQMIPLSQPGTAILATSEPGLDTEFRHLPILGVVVNLEGRKPSFDYLVEYHGKPTLLTDAYVKAKADCYEVIIGNWQEQGIEPLGIMYKNLDYLAKENGGKRLEDEMKELDETCSLADP
jgi:hypothetical protein